MVSQNLRTAVITSTVCAYYVRFACDWHDGKAVVSPEICWWIGSSAPANHELF